LGHTRSEATTDHADFGKSPSAGHHTPADIVAKLWNEWDSLQSQSMTYSTRGSGHIWSEATTDPLGVGEHELRFQGGQFFDSSTEISKVYFRAVANARIFKL
jgi:hypothetical protein